MSTSECAVNQSGKNPLIHVNNNIEGRTQSKFICTGVLTKTKCFFKDFSNVNIFLKTCWNKNSYYNFF